MKLIIILLMNFTWSSLCQVKILNKLQDPAYKTISTKLNAVYITDQKYRILLKNSGYAKDKEIQFSTIIRKTDSLNLIIVKKILNQYGWLAPDLIGQQACKAIFIVIQHADLKTQEHYLPMLRKTAFKNIALGPDLALLEDRIAVYKNQDQIYGSQLGRNEKTGKFYLYPLIDPKNVNVRREKIGLKPIESYLLDFQVIWNPNDYIRR